MRDQCCFGQPYDAVTKQTAARHFACSAHTASFQQSPYSRFEDRPASPLVVPATNNSPRICTTCASRYRKLLRSSKLGHQPGPTASSSSTSERPEPAHAAEIRASRDEIGSRTGARDKPLLNAAATNSRDSGSDSSSSSTSSSTAQQSSPALARSSRPGAACERCHSRKLKCDKTMCVFSLADKQSHVCVFIQAVRSL